MANPTNNPWFAATIGLAGLIVGYVVANGMNGLPLNAGNPSPTPNAPSAPSAPTPAAPSNETPADVDDDEVLGEEDADITIIEFTDYQCPFCARHFEQTVGLIKSTYVDTGKVKYAVRDFPLSFHANAQKAGEASECAADQGKFWEMHDKLFQTRSAWSNTDGITAFKQMAVDLGLDAGDFDSCLDGGTHAQEVKDDMADGSASGIDGTPGFWIIGPDGQTKKISGAYPFSEFQTTIDGMLQ